MLFQMDKADAERNKVFSKMTAFMLEKIKEHEDTYDENNIRDFVDLFIQSSRENKDETMDTFTSNDIYIYMYIYKWRDNH